jgi:outer membrane protein assembly factor BamB
MTHSIRTLCAIAVLLCLLFVPLLFVSSAADWPQWRGVQRNGISSETGLLQEWPKEGPKLLWQVTGIGSGYSTPAVVGDRLYLLSNEGLENEFVQALAVKDGKKVWSTTLGKVGNPDQDPNYPAARSTPTIDGQRLYALSSDGELACVETADGKVLWKKNVRSEFGGQPGNWAYAESPLVDGDTVLCTPGGSNATLVALNKNSGALIWKCAFPGGSQASYASALPLELGGVKQYVQILAKALVGVDAKTGTLLWHYDRTAKGSPATVPTPVVDGATIYSSGYRTGGGGIRLKPNQGRFEVEELYFSPKIASGIGGALKTGDYLYEVGQALQCVEFATGTVKWEERGIGPASLCFADGRLYLHGEDGELALVEATPEGYHEKGRFTPPAPPKRLNEMEKSWTYPVIANGRLYIRDAGTLWCYDVGSKAGGN